MDDFERYLTEILPRQDSLRLVKDAAARYAGAHTEAQCRQTGIALYSSDNFQILEVGVLLLGYAAHAEPEALAFLRETVSVASAHTRIPSGVAERCSTLMKAPTVETPSSSVPARALQAACSIRATSAGVANTGS